MDDDDDDDEIPRYVDRGHAHRQHVLARIAKLWEQHPTLSFCDLVDRYVIDIGSMAGHTTDDDVIARCLKGAEKVASL